MTEMPIVPFGQMMVSRFIVGGNPFCGGSHQSAEMNRRMRDWWTVARIKQALAEAERLGVNTFLGRGDNFITRVLNEYWNEGGTIQWIGQTCPERASVETNIRQIRDAGAKICYLHGGMCDRIFRDDDPERLRPWIALIKEHGMFAGMASHNSRNILRAEEMDLGCEFYMCCFYDLFTRGGEIYEDEDREAMARTIRAVDKPCIAFKIMAAGRNEPEPAFRYAFENIKPTDAVCVGIYTEHQPDQVAEDAALTIRFGSPDP
ncbi:MAG: hypothetical protein J7M38_07960 [Armatimonadetes bacterium]|nr:hypothetical protein [Armatimonadota bacterium]